jgi:chloride channel protein, CIC family
VVGIAAFLGGAYKVPLAGVAFVAETTGAPGYIIPGLLAAALGYVVSGRTSLSGRQRYRRTRELATRLHRPVREVMTREWTEVPPGSSIGDFASRYVTVAKARSLPVAEAGRYLGMVSLDALSAVPVERWGSTAVTEVMAGTRPADPDWPVERVLELMREQGVDRLPIARDGRLVGVVTTSDVLRLEEILDEVSQHGGDGAEA